MEEKNIDFKFTRGNTCPVKFSLTDKEKQPFIMSENDEIWFTMKDFDTIKDFQVQKKLSDGNFIINENELKFRLEQEDTAHLEFKDYEYDIKFKNEEENYVKTLVKGVITLTKESTWIENE